MTPHAFWLLGRDFPELGPLGLLAAPQGGAIALSRGAQPKPYAHVDPNEDTGLIVHCAGGRVLAVADGHNGVGAAELVLEAVRARAEALLEGELSAFERELRGLVAGCADPLAALEPSGTCLIVAALRGRSCRVACFGDSALFRAGSPEPVTPTNDLLLRARRAARALPAAGSWCGALELEPGERVALVSDGVTNYLQPITGIAECLAGDASDAAAAEWIARAACAGGAGDNVCVVTCRAATDGC